MVLGGLEREIEMVEDHRRLTIDWYLERDGVVLRTWIDRYGGY